MNKKIILTIIAINISCPVFAMELGSSLPESDRKLVLSIINDLAPSLYETIIKFDPTGIDHIKEHEDKYNASVNYSLDDGLPIIYIGSEEIKLPILELHRLIGHELGHYVLNHIKKKPTLSHKLLQKEVSGEEFKKGKKVAGQLPFEKTFERAFSRIQEYEADRFAVIELGVPIDSAIAASKRRIRENLNLVDGDSTVKKRHSNPRIPFGRNA